jgi:hypothetical protein
MTDQTTAADQRGPLAPHQETGLSSMVRAQLKTIAINPEIRRRIEEHLEKKG